MKTRLLIFLMGIGLLNSCTNDVDNFAFQPTEISFTEIGKGALYGNGQEGIPESVLTISNNNEWQNLISQMNAVNNTSDSFTETDINFNEFMIIAIFLEVKPSGLVVETENVVENENSITISTLETEGATAVMTQPFSIIKIPKTEKTILLE